MKIGRLTVNFETCTTNLEQRVVKIKFYLNQTAQNIIEVGKELTAAKQEVPHGEWQNWLDENFNLSQQSANRFMRVAERFGNFQSIGSFSSTQLIQLLALPEADTEKFIEEKAAEGFSKVHFGKRFPI